MTWTAEPDALRGRVAVVAGATRGAGRGFATALGEAGATVICTGRSSVSGRGGSDYDRPETIEETAELVTQLGGIGIPIQLDHLDPARVRGLADRIRDEYGQIDILVNDIWGAEVLKGGPADWNTPIWEHDLEIGLRILRLAVDTHLITSHHLLPLLIDRPGGLLIEVTDGTAEQNANWYRISVSVTESNWRDALIPNRAGGLPTAPPGFAESETPRYVGRAAAALAADPERTRWNQRSVTSAQLAREYGFTDVDGRRPDSWSTP